MLEKKIQGADFGQIHDAQYNLNEEMVLYWVGPVPYLELLGGTSKKNTLYIKGGSRQILTSTLFRTVLFVSKRSYQKYKYASLKRYTPKFLGAPQKLTFVNGLASRSFRSQIPAYQNRQKLGVFFAQKQFSWPNGQLLCEKIYTVYSSFYVPNGQFYTWPIILYIQQLCWL